MKHQARITVQEGADAIGALLNGFYRNDTVDVDWRSALEGEELTVRVVVGAQTAIESVTYLADGITQVAPPRTFDPVRCAAALQKATQMIRETR